MCTPNAQTLDYESMRGARCPAILERPVATYLRCHSGSRQRTGSPSRYHDFKPAMIAWAPLHHTIQRSCLSGVRHALGCEYEIELSCRLRGGGAYVVVGGDVQAVLGQPGRPRNGLRPDEGNQVGTSRSPGSVRNQIRPWPKLQTYLRPRHPGDDS